MPTITVQLSDSQGRTSSKEFHLATSVNTVAGVQAALDDLVALWEAASDAGMDNPTVSFPLTMTPIAAKAGSNVDEAARIRLGMDTGVGDENFRLPAPAKTTGVFNYITGGIVDVTDAALTALFALYDSTDVFRIGINSLRSVATLKSGYLEKK